MLYSALAFLAGIGGFQFVPHLPGAHSFWLAAGLLLLFAPARWLRAAGLVCGGFLWSWWHASELMEMRLPPELEGRDVLVQGVVEELPERLGEERIRFRLLIDSVATQDRWRSLELPTRLSWYRDAPDLGPGERWQLQVRLKRPRGLANPGGFDYERWLFARGIRATGYVRSGKANQRLQAGNGYRVQRVRRQLSAHIQTLDTAPTTRGLLRALGVGDRSGMSKDQWLVLQKTGTSHLLAISGLHVGLIAGLVFFVARKAWSAFGDPQRWPAPRVAALCSMLAAFAYALLAGFQVPAQRALVMVWVWMLAVLWTGRPNPWRVWSIALWGVLLLDPLSVLGAGFWLSFSAVALILLLTVGYRRHHGRVGRLLSLQLGLVAGLTPVLWLWFHQISLLAPLANLIAIPWVGVLVVPFLLLGLLCLPVAAGVADTLFGISAMLLTALWWLLEQLAALPGNLWQAPALAVLWTVPLAVGLVCLLLPRALSLTAVGILLVLPAFWIKPERPDSGDLWFTLLDVGQGLAVVVETRRHVLVYDTGPAFGSGFNAGEAVVAPFLLWRGYRHVDRLVISHADIDHIGGGLPLFARLQVFSIQSGEPAAIDWARSSRCGAGEKWRWDGVGFEYLAPAHPRQGNDASCVLRVETADGRVLLLPGDIERTSERELLGHHRERLAAEFLVAPHHGSLTSSTAEWVSAVDPEWVLFPVGYRNRFGFPRPEVVERYRAGGAGVLDSAGSGAIQVRVEAGKPAQVTRYRRRQRRYWMTKT